MDESRFEWPVMLWHYTNLESLALILTNRTLRLMPLTGMDDPLESQTRDVANLGRFFFASCWTDDSQESIPMWKMYASLDSGIRIGLPPMPFAKHNYTKNEFSRITGIPIDHISAADTMSSFMPLEDFAKGLLSPAFLEGNGVLQKVHYTDAVDDLVPRVLSTDGNSAKVATSKMGTYKSSYWSFQREWRYVMSILPYKVLGDLSQSVDRWNEMFIKMINGELMPPCNYYDLQLDPEAVKGMVVTPSPRMSAGNMVLLNTLLESQGLAGNLKQSELDGML